MLANIFLLTLASCFIGTISANNNVDNLLGVVQIFRHGQRSPTGFYSNDPYADESYWPVAEGQLTNDGKQQQYALGQFTRKRYDGFIPKRYNPAKFYVRTTDVDRTHMSAQANVAAIFPPSGSEIWKRNLKWQPIPIHPIDEAVLSGLPDCTLYYQEWIPVTLFPSIYLPTSINYTELFKLLTKQTGSSVSTISSVQTIYDDLFIEELNGYKLPEWTNAVYPEPLKTVGALTFLTFSYSDNQKRLTVGSWLNTVIENFEKLWIDPTANPGYQIYSAHDINIASVLNTLGAFVPHSPYYASSIYFELRNVSGEAIVNIWHKDQDEFEQIALEGCALDCPLATFKELLSPWLIDTAAWRELCSSISSNFTSSPYLKELSEAEAELANAEIIHKATKVNGGKRPKNGHGLFSKNKQSSA